MLVAGTYFPIENLPEWAQVPANFNPLYHCVELVRHAAFGFEPIDLYHFGVLVASGSSPGGSRRTAWRSGSSSSRHYAGRSDRRARARPGDRAAVRRDPRSSCCSRVGATPSACSTAPSRSAPTSPRCTSTTGCGRRRRRRGASARELCERLGVALEVHRARGPRRPGTSRRGRATSGWASARSSRSSAAAVLATGHTATDQAETVLYRLAARPGRRALLGMSPRDGRLDPPAARRRARPRPRSTTRHRGLAWREDADERRRRVRAQPRPPRARPRARAHPPGRPAQRRPHRASCCATRPRCSTTSSTPRWPASDRHRRRDAPAPCRPRSRGSWSAGSPRTRSAACARARRHASTTSSRWTTERSTWATACVPSSKRACCAWCRPRRCPTHA